MVNSILMLTLNSLQCMFRIFILVILDVSMLAGVFPKIDDIVVRRRFQCIPNGCLTLHKFNRRKKEADAIF